MKLSVVSIVAGLIALVLVFEMLRRRRLREKYAVLWVVIGLGVLVVSIWRDLLYWAADLLGIATPSNLLFFIALAVSFAVALQLSSEVGFLEEETRTLAEEVGMLRLNVEEIDRKLAERPAAERPDADPAGVRRPEQD